MRTGLDGQFLSIEPRPIPCPISRPSIASPSPASLVGPKSLRLSEFAALTQAHGLRPVGFLALPLTPGPSPPRGEGSNRQPRPLLSPRLLRPAGTSAPAGRGRGG